MSLSEEIRNAIQAARATSEPNSNDPFRKILDEVVEGLTDESVQATLTPGRGGRFTLLLAPAHQPGRAIPMLEVVIALDRADVLLEPRQCARSPEELAEILKRFVTTEAFLECLQELIELSKQPVEGFLRVAPGTVSRQDLMLDVPPEAQREIAEKVGGDISLRLRISRFPGAGKFESGTPYQVLESAGYSITLSAEVEEEANGELRIKGHVARSGSH